MPIASTGQISQLNNHGAIFYVRPLNALLAQSSLGFVGAALVAFMLLKWRYGSLNLPYIKESRYLPMALVVGTTIHMFWPIFKL
jgi:hypothetical protein